MRPFLPGALLLFVACADRPPPRAGVEIPRTQEPPPPRPVPPDLSIPERMAVIAADEKRVPAGRWDLWRGTLWPSGVSAYGFYLRPSARMEHVLPADGAIVSPQGGVLTFGDAPYLFPAAKGEPVPLLVPIQDASFSPDGASIFASGDGAWMVLDAADGKVLRRRELDEPASATALEWRGDRLLVGEEGAYQVVGADDLSTVISRATGPLDPTATRIVDMAEPRYDEKPSPSGEALRILDMRTGAVIHQQRGEPPGYSRTGHRQVAWSPDGRRLSWYAGSLHLLDVERKRTVVVPNLPLGEANAESNYTATPTADGTRVCFAMDGYDASYDVARRSRLRDRPGLAFRCAVADGFGHVVEIPLRPHEAVVDLPAEGFGNWPDIALSRDRTRAAALVTDPRIPWDGAHPLSLLVVEVAKRRLVHRVEIGTIPPGGWRSRLTAAEDANAVDVEIDSASPDHERWRVDFETGARTPAPPEQAPPAPEVPASPLFAAKGARVEVRSGRVIWTGPQGTVAYRLDGSVTLPALHGGGVLERLDQHRPDGGALLGGRSIDAITRPDGVARLRQVASGTTVAMLIPFAQGSILAMLADGRVDWLGDPVAAPDVLCLRGTTVVPLDRCAPLLDRGALERAVTGG
jgi:hypothetical protein